MCVYVFTRNNSLHAQLLANSLFITLTILLLLHFLFFFTNPVLSAKLQEAGGVNETIFGHTLPMDFKIELYKIHNFSAFEEIIGLTDS